MNNRERLRFLLALFLPFTLILGGGIWGTSAQHTHRSADQGGVISWIPTGFVGCFAGNSPPTNTLEAYGQAVSRVTYASLFGIIGTTHGAGDGVTTFNLPDLRGRTIIGLDNAGGTPANRVTAAAADTLGGTGGSEIMTIAQMPAHTHGVRVDDNTAGVNENIDLGLGGTGVSQVANQTNSTGGGAAFNPPFIALKCVIGT